jgi:hypothetical protein
VRPAAGAHAVVGAVLGDDERARFGQIEHLPGLWPLLMAGVIAAPQAVQEGGK